MPIDLIFPDLPRLRRPDLQTHSVAVMHLRYLDMIVIEGQVARVIRVANRDRRYSFVELDSDCEFWIARPDMAFGPNGFRAPADTLVQVVTEPLRG